MSQCQHGKSSTSFCFACTTINKSLTPDTAFPLEWEMMYQWPPTQPAPVQRGWECPRCAHVYAPSVIMCLHCPATTETVTTTDANDTATAAE
jgi:hypothetical protein